MSEHNQASEEPLIERRTILKGAGALGLGAVVSTLAGNLAGVSPAFAAGAGHQHHGGSSYKAMADAVNACVNQGNACAAHCLEVIKSGDLTIADCMASVQETAAFSATLAYMTAVNSKHLNAMCELAIEVCGDCQKQCEKHSKHASCKAYAEACAACVKACKEHLAA